MKVYQRNLLLRIILYTLVVGALSLILFVDAEVVESKFFEDSFTERAQEAIFLLTLVIYLVVQRRYSDVAPLALMLAGFFALCFVRELDALLEQNIGTGTWQALATIVLIAMIWVAWKNWNQLWRTAGDYVETYAFGLFVAGFITTFIFSRIFGNESLWEAIMGEVYQRNVKNAVEESVELLGDAMFLFSAVEFYLRQLRLSRTQEQQ